MRAHRTSDHLCELICDPEELARLGGAARKRARDEFLGLDHLLLYAKLIERIDGDG